MKIITNIIRLAHIPPHVTITEMDGLKGFWTTNQDGHRIFLDIKSHRIIIPKALRGQNPQDVSDEDFKAIPTAESGNSSYKLWQEDFNRNKAATKIYDGFEFTNNGKILINRLKKSILKHHLDNIAVYSLDPKYSIKPEMFDKLMQQTNIDRAKYMAKIIAKKYRVIIELLKASGKIRAANKIDGDFYYNWNKLEPLFDFDPAKYKPKLDAPEPEEEVEENPAPTDTLQNIVQAFVAEVEPLIDAQMSDFANILDSFKNVVSMGNIALAQKAYEVMTSLLMKNIGRYGLHSIGLASEKIIQLPSYALLHHRLFEEGQ
jgi:hypothetical protein